MKTKTSLTRNSIHSSLQRCDLLLTPLLLVCFALLPRAQAVVPAPDGGYPSRNTAEGDFALFSDDTDAGNDNTAIGFSALYSNIFGSENTATGSRALYSNIGGIDNTATGIVALYSNTIGLENTATGATALLRNTTGNDNTATGVAALQSNTTGSSNTATGVAALGFNTTGNNNTATGDGALLSNTNGFNNTANGVLVLSNNTHGVNNTATGNNALYSNEIGGNNTANGIEALQSNTTGSFNTGNGVRALINNTTGSRNIALGAGAGSNLTTGNNTSSQRFKDDIKPMDKASEAILALKPVTFHHKKEVDPDGIPQFGLVAEDVEKVNPDLVARDEQGKVYTVRYEAVNAMLLNEFLKEYRTVQEQKAIVAQLKRDFQSRLTEQQKQIEALTAGLQKVSAQIEAGKPAPQMVVNNQ